MQDFEKLGAFYLGKRFDSATDSVTDELTLYDSKDLTTHGVIIGMTGSGKTGLGVGLIEEAALDHIPVIAIDPKGDLGNLLLNFPNLAATDFEPWVDAGAALKSGKSVADHAAATAELWRNGLEKWGQSPARIKKLSDSAEMTIYTPGSNAGTPISVLKTLSVAPEIVADGDAFRERVQSTVQSILTLLDIDADPLTSREHILLSNILSDSWTRGEAMSLPSLIAAVQNPPITRVGVMEIDSFYPANERFSLAMRINNLLAAPGFEVWTQGTPLNIHSLLYTESGKPRVSIMSIAHLNDAERMFFVTALLGELVSWMRMQTGSPSLRAILYMDEVFGYLPPVANPPCKPLFLTLLKQARAYGVGLVLATQNPVDLDYKALSNMGTWMIGRLQTKRDIDRVRSGLEAAAGAGNLAVESLDKTLAGMRKRCFLLHNVHESQPTVFHTRWVMSYLAGPLTAEQIKKLTPAAAQQDQLGKPATKPASALARKQTSSRPLLDPDISQWFIPADNEFVDPQKIIYVPSLLVAARIHFSRARPLVEHERQLVVLVPASNGARAFAWETHTTLGLAASSLVQDPIATAAFSECPDSLTDPRKLSALTAKTKRWLRSEFPIVLFKSSAHKIYSEAGETEGDFRIRLQELGNRERDTKIGALRAKYEKSVARLQKRLQKAEYAISRESEEARGHKLDTALSFGTAILGALLGRKTVSVTSASRVGSAIKKASRSRQQSSDVQRAQQAAADIQAELDLLNQEFEEEVAELEAAYDAQSEKLSEQSVAAKLTDIEIDILAVGWEPHAKTADGKLVTIALSQ